MIGVICGSTCFDLSSFVAAILLGVPICSMSVEVEMRLYENG
jgi:hypothetical protein